MATATTETPAVREGPMLPRGFLVRTVRESLIVFGRNIKKVVRVPLLLFFSLFQPMLWLLLFTQIFKRLGDFPQFQSQGYTSYLQFFAPSVLTMTVLTSAFQSGMGMVTDLLQGILIIVVALAMGATIKTGFVGALVMLFVAACFGIVWAALSNVVALRTKNSEMTMMIGILLTFPLLFLSTAMMPSGLLPHWLETVGKFNPVTYVINTARQFMNFGYAWMELGKALGIIALVGLFTLTGATRAFRKATS